MASNRPVCEVRRRVEPSARFTTRFDRRGTPLVPDGIPLCVRNGGSAIAPATVALGHLFSLAVGRKTAVRVAAAQRRRTAGFRRPPNFRSWRFADVIDGAGSTRIRCFAGLPLAIPAAHRCLTGRRAHLIRGHAGVTTGDVRLNFGRAGGLVGQGDLACQSWRDYIANLDHRSVPVCGGGRDAGPVRLKRCRRSIGRLRPGCATIEEGETGRPSFTPVR